MARTTYHYLSMVTIMGSVLTSGYARAEAPATRAQEKVKVEKRMARIEERQEAVRTEGEVSEITLELSKRYVELARMALKYDNPRAAKELVDQAERELKRLEKEKDKEEVQQ